MRMFACIHCGTPIACKDTACDACIDKIGGIMNRHFEMSLGQQFADLDRAYRHCCEDKLTLLGRCAELEDLVIEYHDLCLVLPDTGNPGIQAMLSDMQKRTRTLLHEEQSEQGKEETR